MRLSWMLCPMFLIFGGAIGAAAGYFHAKASFMAVGVADGEIKARWEVITKVREMMNPNSCSAHANSAQFIEFVSAKSESIYFFQGESGAVFCDMNNLPHE
jgi:hypothetical protein